MVYKNIDVWEVVTLEEAYEECPHPSARDAVREKFPGQWSLWCKFIYSFNTLQELQDTVILVHAPLNCTSCMRSYKSSLYYNWGSGFVHAPTTGMDKRHVIFGAEEELRQAVLAVDRDYRPKLIVILTGCAPGIILDDVNRVVEQTQPRVGSKVIHVPSAGFDYDWNYWDDCLPLYVEKLMDPPKEVHKDWVNILGNNKEPYNPVHGERCEEGTLRAGARRFPGDADELGRLVEGLGLKVHRVLMSGDYDWIRTAPEAGANVITCGTYGTPLAMMMQKKFGTPFVNHIQAVGLERTAMLIRELGDLTDRREEAEKFIAREETAIHDLWEQTKEMVAGKTALVN